MKQILTNYSIKKYNTFGIEALVEEFVEINSVQELKEILSLSKDKEIFILGGGSNMLLTQNISSRVLFINIKGIEIVNQDNDFVLVKVSAGEIWHDFVIWAIDNNFGGIENLSLIPGFVGATPIQNIGAYGIEIKDVFESCTAIHIKNQEERTFFADECNFSYRESVFKQELKNQYIITSVTYKLTKRNHKISTSYGVINDEISKLGITTPTIRDISNAIISIRKSKLPDPKILGNSGSFFKNPIIEKETYNKLKSTFPDMPNYFVSESLVKIPAGWLIEQCGLKGYREGEAGVHDKQALVLVNYGKASGSDVYNLSKKVQKSVFQKFGITIESEVNII